MHSAQKIILATASVSGLFAVALGFAWRVYSSELAQAQAADSLLDFAGAFVLAWVVRVAEQPRDDNHPWGHGRAEPLGALAVAMFAAMLALRVGQGAVQALWQGS
ncbi:MAG TPA: cation transporter, partial [Polyangiaceae bacterium]|nr:cation transporter [Polyangiaceae bacterium]